MARRPIPTNPVVKPYSNRAGLTFNTDLAFWGTPVLERDNGELYCPGFTGNTYSNNPWDYLAFFIPLVGISIPFAITPGICRIICEKHRMYDKKKSAGTDGARVTMHGLQVAEVKIHIKIWTPEQYKQLSLLWQTLFPGPQAASTTAPSGANNVQTIKDTAYAEVTRPFQVAHPQLKESRINTLIFTGCNGPEESEPHRARVFTMHAVEYLPPDPAKNATSSPRGVVAIPGTRLNAGANGYLPPGNTTPISNDPK